MDKETYYAVAVLVSSMSAAISAFNTFLLLRDRRHAVSIEFYWSLGYSGQQKFFHYTACPKDHPRDTFRAAVLITNQSRQPLNITSCTLVKRTKTPWFIFKRRIRETLDVQFTATENPVCLEANKSTFAIISGEIVRRNVGNELQFLINGRNEKLKIRGAFISG